jgi:hypothetical protein
MYKYLLLIWLLVPCAFTAMAQQPDTSKTILKSKTDTLISTKRDTDVVRSFKPKLKKERAYHPDSTHSPHTAVMHSLLIPGWGQVYNRRWWKVPVVYGGLGLLGAAIVFNTKYYNEFETLAIYREHGTKIVPGIKYYAEAQLYANQQDQALDDAADSYRRNRDLSILGVLALWGINVVDAYIDAKFINSFTIDNNFGMKVSPGLINQPVFALNTTSTYIPGIKITFTIR